jgi:hypothetical protein
MRIYRKNTSTDLSNVRLDFNVDAYDQNINSPQDINLDKGHYLVTVSRTGYDSNSNYFINADSNKTVTIYLEDTTGPSVGATTIVGTGFTIYGSYFKGTGYVRGGVATDGGSGIDNTTCEIQYFAAGAWFSGTWDTNHCNSSNFTAANTSVYTMNSRISDVSGNVGTGTATGAYTGDSAAPTTTLTSSVLPTNDLNIALSCTDAGAGCKTVAYKLDSDAWVYTSGSYKDFNITGKGAHTLLYYSSDNLDNNEAQNTTTLYLYGMVHLQFYDETTLAPLTGVTVTVIQLTNTDEFYIC